MHSNLILSQDVQSPIPLPQLALDITLDNNLQLGFDFSAPKTLLSAVELELFTELRAQPSYFRGMLQIANPHL